MTYTLFPYLSLSFPLLLSPTHTHTHTHVTGEFGGGKEGKKVRIAYTIKISEIKAWKAVSVNKGQLENGYCMALWRPHGHGLFLFEVKGWASLEKLPHAPFGCPMMGGDL